MEMVASEIYCNIMNMTEFKPKFHLLNTIIPFLPLLGTGFAMCSTKESHDSDADLDVDGDDTLEYGKAQYPCLFTRRRLALRWCSVHRNSN